MKLQSVTSSAVKAVGYEDGVLEVEYTSGHRYRMTGISQAQYDALHAKDASVGRHLHALRAAATKVERVEP